MAEAITASSDVREHVRVSRELRNLLGYLALHHVLGFAIGLIATGSVIGGVGMAMLAPCLTVLVATTLGARRAPA